jgi:hypothetical protein
MPEPTRLLRQCEQFPDDGCEQRVNTQKESGEDDREDQHHDRGLRGFLAGWPHNFADLGTGLANKFTGARLCHILVLCFAHYG